MSTSGSKSNEHVAHFLVDIHNHYAKEKMTSQNLLKKRWRTSIKNMEFIINANLKVSHF